MGAGQDIRQLFTGATLKRIIGLPHVMADTILATIHNPEKGAVAAISKNFADVYVHFVDTMSNIAGIGRLHAPANILWRMPLAGDSAMVLKPSEADGPGVPYVIYGDGGQHNSVPPWLGSSDCGLSAQTETLHLESQNNNVVIQSNVSGASAEIELDAQGNVQIIPMNGQNVTITVLGSGKVTIGPNPQAVARIGDFVTGTAGPYPLANGTIISGSPWLAA